MQTLSQAEWTSSSCGAQYRASLGIVNVPTEPYIAAQLPSSNVLHTPSADLTPSEKRLLDLANNDYDAFREAILYGFSGFEVSKEELDAACAEFLESFSH